ncbi:3-isopropylmalate dehydratase large subunit [Falsiroseomonas stagni]|uniref:3-isopropylmalate dehydratase large subunit n=1 Tax=Falsiroseomonas stagni DSM 19981 TaxID=1123062 RepID=A0A1I4AXR2_9PROT|nr:3-isopropylmalate dehydratase large subunit [Falsiroseomonas stagni]SFK60970.1 3-isopropylmalate/(R)-2-methylmalate dehydratase large subunit [Falsiroseomonas stagni DSM 19981]
MTAHDQFPRTTLDHVPRTMFDKIWDRHRVLEREDGQVLLYVDRHLVHDGCAPAFAMLRARGQKLRAPERVFASPDHYVPTDTRETAEIANPELRGMVEALDQAAAESGFRLFGLKDANQGIVHVVGPETGISQPGMIIVCGDSHTSTHGALGALAFGIGMTEVGHVLATQCLWQRKPATMRITVDGTLGFGVTAKDLILHIIATIGAAGATGHVIEYAGPAVRALTMEGRLTLCNMSIEAGARAGMVAPDDVTIDYLRGRDYAPRGEEWDRAVERWRALASDADARFDREVVIDGNAVAPTVTWGNSPQDAVPATGAVPDPAAAPNPERRAAMEEALAYMGLDAGQRMADIPVQRVFIGSCTNGRIEDFRAAAAVLRGRRVAEGVVAWAVPGSAPVKRRAEAEGLDRVFRDAGFDWREAGCAMCLGTNGEIVAPGVRVASTSNRNFRGRQGPGARTHLMSPAMAAAAAVTGRITDVRDLVQGDA